MSIEVSFSAPQEPLVADAPLTPAEIDVISRITGKRAAMVCRPNCIGEKMVADYHNLRNRFIPSSFQDINQHEASRLMCTIKQFWQKKFVTDGRQRSFQIVSEVNYPFGTPYYFRAIINLHLDRVEIISPFKWSATSEELSLQ